MSKRRTLRQRAERAVDSYMIPPRELSADDARLRTIIAWLDGYRAAIRDVQRANRAMIRAYNCPLTMDDLKNYFDPKQIDLLLTPLKGVTRSTDAPAAEAQDTPHGNANVESDEARSSTEVRRRPRHDPYARRKPKGTAGRD